MPVAPGTPVTSTALPSFLCSSLTGLRQALGPPTCQLILLTGRGAFRIPNKGRRAPY